MVNPQDLADLIEADDLKGDLALVRDVCGLDVAKAIAMGLSGVSLYVPDATLKPARIRLACKLMRQGWTPKRVAAYLGVSERWLCTQLKWGEPQYQQLLFSDN